MVTLSDWASSAQSQKLIVELQNILLYCNIGNDYSGTIQNETKSPNHVFIEKQEMSSHL